MLMLNLRVLPYDRPTMFLFFSKIFVTNGLLVRASDEHLQSSIYHELGHKKQFKIMFCIYLINIALFLQLILLFSYHAVLFLPLFYMLFCWYCRIGEYHADSYALVHTSKSGMIELLEAEGNRLDTRLSMLFYPIRFHPDKHRRIRNLGLSPLNI